jgi:hypothetical protein
MKNLHLLQPCALCPTRMAVPGQAVCTVCDAVTIPAMAEALIIPPVEPSPQPCPEELKQDQSDKQGQHEADGGNENVINDPHPPTLPPTEVTG